MATEAPKYWFISNRDVTIRSTTGRSLYFPKGKPTHVPPMLHQVALERGVLPCNEDGSPLDAGDAPQVVTEKKVMVAPEDPAQRKAAITSALEEIVKRNDARDFTAGGTPSEAAVRAIVGWRVDQKEVRAAWVELRAKNAKTE